MASTDPLGEVPGVNVSDSQGILIGSGNQFNTWAQKPPLDPAALNGLSPHAAVTRLQQLSHDELVDFIAKVEPDGATEIFKTFLRLDQAKVVAALADINHLKASELIKAAGAERILDGLPYAADAINRKAASVKWAPDGPMERFFGTGYARKYKEGHIVWSAINDAHVTRDAIRDYYMGNSFKCGFPTGDLSAAPQSAHGASGIRQEFQKGTVYTSKHGTFLVANGECYANEGWSGGWLGFPVEEMKATSSVNRVQEFEGGSIYSLCVGTSVGVAVRREVLGAMPEIGAWRPLSNEVAVVSSHRTQGTVQKFEVESTTGVSQVKVYYSVEYGPVIVSPEIWSYYKRLTAEKSGLGFPISSRRYLSASTVSAVQEFEGGKIYWRAGSVPVTVLAQVTEAIGRSRRTRGLIGFPLTEEKSVVRDESERIQFFENGVVTRRDGKYEVWLRP